MRILVATHQWFPDYTGGSARVATETARALARRGHELVVLAPRGKPPVAESEAALSVERVLPRGRLPRTLTDVLWTAAHARRLRRSSFDVLVAHHPTTAVGLSSTGLQAPLVFVYHASVVRELAMLRGTLAPATRRVASLSIGNALAHLERRTIARAERVVALSEYSRSLVAMDHPSASSRVCIAPGGVDQRAFVPAAERVAVRRSLGLEGEGPLILGVRRLEPCLGLETLLAAVSLVPLSPPPTVALAGQGSLAPELSRLGGELGLDRRLKLLGNPSPEVLRALYAAADVFVMSPAPHEGFGLATLEALASGTPAVGVPLGATPELLEPLEPRLVATESSAPALAEAIARALQLADPGFRLRCREYAANRYGWDRVAERWEQVLADATERRPSAGVRARSARAVAWFKARRVPGDKSVSP
jgi:glycosyltransferase involved in cell wall biosynthesis